MNNSKTEVKRYLPPSPTDAQRYWFDHLQKQQSSGLSMAVYAKEHGLSKHTLYVWSQQLRIPEPSDHESSMPLFQAVQVAPQPLAGASTEIVLVLRLPNGVECELRHANAETCVEVLQALVSLPT